MIVIPIPPCESMIVVVNQMNQCEIR